MCHRGTPQSAECHPGTSDSLRNFTPVVRKVSPQNFLPFWEPTAENYELVFLTVVRPNGTFDQFATKTWVRSFWGATMSQIFVTLTWRDFKPFANGPENFPPGFFTSFWRPTTGNYESVFLTGVWPNGAFDRHTTKWCFWSAYDQNLCSVFLTVVRPGKASKIRD